MSQQPAPAEQLFQMCLGFIPAICLNIVAHLSIADQLASGPKDIDEIARASNANSDALYRVMRAVSSVGVFHEVERRRFAQTPASDMLRRDHPQSLRPFVLLFPERTADEYRELFARSGFRVTRIVPTQAPQSVIEAVLA